MPPNWMSKIWFKIESKSIIIHESQIDESFRFIIDLMGFFYSCSAEPNVRNQFTLGWHPMEYSKEFYEKSLMDSVRSHLYDYTSPVAMSEYLKAKRNLHKKKILSFSFSTQNKIIKISFKFPL